MISIKYQLYKETVPEYSAQTQILYNRGIEVEDQQAWLSAGKECFNDWRLLDNMELIVQKVHFALEESLPITIIQDCDCDGWSATSMLVNYLHCISPSFVAKNVTILTHEGKQHGLKDLVSKIPKETKLLLIPDAGSNDVEECKLLCPHMDICILDHHEANPNPYATIANPQLCDYPNKALTGAGVVWQFCRAYDEIYGYDFAKDFTDLAALGMIGDMSNYKELETRAIVNVGLKDIKNPFFAAMARKNKFSIDKMNGINYYSVAFYVVPFINACVRSGTQEEKDTVFKAMLVSSAFEKVESSKRGEKGLFVYLYEEAVTVAERVKRRQTKLQDESMAILQKKIEDEHLTDHAIITCVCGPDEVEKNIAGLVANRIQAMYQHPTLVLIKTKDADDSEIVYRGSARNYSMCENQDMRAVCLASEEMLLAQGHANAFGAAVAASHFDAFVKKTDELYSGIDFTPSYTVDYIWNQNTIDSDKILNIGAMNIYGQEIPESKVAIENIPLSEENVLLMGLAKGHPTLKIQVGNVSIMKFKSSEEEYEQFIQPNTYLTLVGKCSVNIWNGSVSPQIIIDDFELKQEWRF